MGLPLMNPSIAGGMSLLEPNSRTQDRSLIKEMIGPGEGYVTCQSWDDSAKGRSSFHICMPDANERHTEAPLKHSPTKGTKYTRPISLHNKMSKERE